MAAVSKFLRPQRRGEGKSGFEHWCPGCEGHHYIQTEGSPTWSFDGDLDQPTFGPSVKITHPGTTLDECREWGVVQCCHYFLRGGRIEFCGDSTHALAGQTVDLPELPNLEGED